MASKKLLAKQLALMKDTTPSMKKHPEFLLSIHGRVRCSWNQPAEVPPFDSPMEAGSLHINKILKFEF